MIGPGSELFADDTRRCAGRLGAVVKDLRDNLLLLTSREMMERAQTVYAEMGGNVVRVGERRDDYFPQGDRQDAARLSAWFFPDPAVQIALTGPQDLVGGEEVDLLREEVSVLGADVGPTGYISRVNWFAKFSVDGQCAPATHEGLLRISSLEAGTAFFSPGQSGAMVTTRSGAFVGIIVGVVDGDAVAVPLKRILHSEELALASRLDIDKHNEQAAATAHQTRVATVGNSAIDSLRVSLASARSKADSRRIVKHWVLEEGTELSAEQVDVKLIIGHVGFASGVTATQIYGVVAAKFINAKTEAERMGLATGLSDLITEHNLVLSGDDDRLAPADRPRGGHAAVFGSKQDAA